MFNKLLTKIMISKSLYNHPKKESSQIINIKNMEQSLIKI